MKLQFELSKYSTVFFLMMIFFVLPSDIFMLSSKYSENKSINWMNILSDIGALLDILLLLFLYNKKNFSLSKSFNFSSKIFLIYSNKTFE